MLTSPVNVTIAANGATLKPHAAPPDTGARREAMPPAGSPAQPVAATIEPQLPSNSPMTSVNAVTATAGGRTILQDLSLQVASMLRLARRPDENLTALFIRIIAAVEAMPQAERLQFEVKTGLKAQKITLADLAMALRNPDGIEAARLTAIAEAPSAVPGRTAVTAATTTYLQEGTADGHAEETLAMRAAARNSAAGQNVFSADAKARHAEPRPLDAKALQSQLKSMFEPGSALKLVENEGPPRKSEAEPGDARALRPGVGEAPPPRAAAKDTVVQAHPPAPLRSETVVISTSNLRLDTTAVEKIRSMAQTIAEDLPVMAEDQALPTDDGPEPVDRRLQTMLTLKGLAEVVVALPAKAAEFLAGVQQDRNLPAAPAGSQVTTGTIPETVDSGQSPELAATGDPAAKSEASAGTALPDEIPAETTKEPAVPTAGRNAASGADPARPETAYSAPARPDPAQYGVPFPYAQLPPAKEQAIEVAEDDESRERADDEKDEDDEAEGEKQRPRDEYDAIHDPEPEEDAAIRITRDSSEADRAFALYQRMGGF